MPLRSDRRRGEQGAALIELAIILPVLLVLGLGIVEFSLALASYTTLVKQAEAAARLLSTRVPGKGHEEASCLAAHGVASPLPCAGIPVVPGLTPTLVTVVDSNTVGASATHRAQMTATISGRVAVNLVTVTISNYTHPLLVGGMLNGLTGGETSLTFQPISVTMRQQL